jgi:serine/threonine-protein kinase
LGPYEILAPLGAGGMGEVYRARDPRMGREVAIKVSAECFSDRFEREVRAVAALNHANICQVYDVGPSYLVMELVEGSTLAERIKTGALPLEEALPIARQIADALEAAHERGIIHRDLKPANIKIKPDGAVKVLDFGLAKIAEQTAAACPEESPTVAMGATVVGQVMGTAAYMAPEQARGKTVDKRADIWAFGVVLYEMLTGRRLFQGETISDTLASVLAKEPKWEGVPAKVQHLLKSCLEKDPKRRLRDIGDAWQLLEEAPLQATRPAQLPWAVAGALALALAAVLWAPWRSASPPIEHSRVPLDFDLGPDASLGTTVGPAALLSPDGTSLVFVSQGSDETARLYVRRLDQPKALRLPGTEGAYAPFFSPDGQWVGFFAAGKLRKTHINGGESISLCEAPAGRGGTWGEDGYIIASLDSQGSLSRIPAEGGKPVEFTRLNVEIGENTHRWPQILPGGHAVLFSTSTAYGNYDEASISVVSVKDGQRKVLLDHAGMYPRYVPSGHLAYATKGTLYAMPFDLERLEVRGTAARLETVATNPNIGFAQIDFSRNGTLVYRTGGAEGRRTIQWLDASGKTTPLGFEPALYGWPRLSPDGSHLAYVVSQGPSTDLWVYDLRRGFKARLTNGRNAQNFVWSQDGRLLIFQTRGGLYWTPADEPGKEQLLMETKGVAYFPSSLSLDGTRLAVSDQILAGGAEIRTVPLERAPGQLRAGQPQLFQKTSTSLAFPSFSPDGSWVAYADTEGGPYEIYVRGFPDGSIKHQISTGGGWLPVWSPNGRELFYRTEDQRIMVAAYKINHGAFAPESPRVWCGKQLANLGLTRNFDLDPHGNRIVAVMPLESSEPRENQSHVMLEVRFFDEIRRLVGQRK